MNIIKDLSILKFATITHKKDLYIDVCDQYYPDNKNKRFITLITIDNRQNEDEYNNEAFCHISTLLDSNIKQAYYYLEKVFSEYFNRINKDFIDTNPLNTNNYGLMLFARGLQVPLVHYNVKHADEYLEMRSTAYNNIKNTVGKIKALLQNHFVEYVDGDNTKKMSKHIT